MLTVPLVKQFVIDNVQFTVSIEDLSKGIYFVKLISEQGIYTQKLVVK
jgi:hypothetical protein